MLLTSSIMGMQRDQVDLQLARIAADARQCVRANPEAVASLVVARTRELLRVAALEHHLHICDTAQYLMLVLDDDPDNDPPPPNAIVGLVLAEDPFDLDAYVSPEAAVSGPAPEFVPRLELEPMPDPEPEPAPEPEPPAATSVENERRQDRDRVAETELRRGLSSKQLATLDTMSQFGWTLRFVRRPMFQPPIPVAFDRNRQRYVVIEADGSVDEDPGLQIRD